MLDISIVMALINSILGLFTLPPNVSTFISSMTSQLPTLVAAGTDVVAFVQTQLQVVQTMINQNRDPTQAEWDALNTAMSTELAKLNIQAMHPSAPGMP
jgi:hypothetical protein